MPCIAGMLGFLPKPLRIDELSEALVRYAVPLHRVPKIMDPGTTATETKVLNPIETQAVLMDGSRLEQFKDFDDEERSMTREVIALFISDAPQRAQDIAHAYHATDSAALSSAAHALKGAASNVGASALTDACFALEQSCMQGVWPKDASSQVGLVAELTHKTLDALQNVSF